MILISGLSNKTLITNVSKFLFIQVNIPNFLKHKNLRSFINIQFLYFSQNSWSSIIIIKICSFSWIFRIIWIPCITTYIISAHRKWQCSLQFRIKKQLLYILAFFTYINPFSLWYRMQIGIKLTLCCFISYWSPELTFLLWFFGFHLCFVFLLILN